MLNFHLLYCRFDIKSFVEWSLADLPLLKCRLMMRRRTYKNGPNVEQ